MRKPNTSALYAPGRVQFNWLDTATGQLFGTQASRESWVQGDAGGSANGFWAHSACPDGDGSEACGATYLVYSAVCNDPCTYNSPYTMCEFGGKHFLYKIHFAIQ